jgi:hypothetical protein
MSSTRRSPHEREAVFSRRLPRRKEKGQGDEVLIMESAAFGPARLTHDGESNFAVWAYGDSTELLVNEIGHYRGRVLLPDGTVVLDIQADGKWSIALG